MNGLGRATGSLAGQQRATKVSVNKHSGGRIPSKYAFLIPTCRQTSKGTGLRASARKDFRPKLQLRLGQKYNYRKRGLASLPAMDELSDVCC